MIEVPEGEALDRIAEVCGVQRAVYPWWMLWRPRMESDEALRDRVMATLPLSPPPYSARRVIEALAALPCVQAVSFVGPGCNGVAEARVRVELSRRSWLALGALHGYVRGEAERILRASLPSYVSFTLEVL